MMPCATLPQLPNSSSISFIVQLRGQARYARVPRCLPTGVLLAQGVLRRKGPTDQGDDGIGYVMELD